MSITSGPAGPFHHAAPPEDTEPQIWVRRIPTPALVLGSTQPNDLVRRDRAEADGIEVCRRRSGGGLVFIDPATDCWIDLIVPSGSSRWHRDVGLAFHWVGEHWASVLTEIDPEADPVVHRLAERRPAGKLWCFADIGHGEVSIGGSKVVGLSQRRTRNWLRIQTLVLGSWPGRRLRSYVDPRPLLTAAEPELDRDLLDPVSVAAGFPGDGPAPAPEALIERFIATVPPP